MKDAVSRVAVEIIKREWPQMWPSMLNDLYEACNKGVCKKLICSIITTVRLEGRDFVSQPCLARGVEKIVAPSLGTLHYGVFWMRL